MKSEFELLEIYGDELKNGRCPEEILNDIIIFLTFMKTPESGYMIVNGTRDINSTAQFYYDNGKTITHDNLTPFMIKEIYQHLKIIANNVVINYRRMLTEFYFKMLKFQFAPQSQTHDTMRSLVDQYHTFNWNSENDPYGLYVANIFTNNIGIIERCYSEARDDLIRIYELNQSEIPVEVSDFYDFELFKSNKFDIYEFINKYSVIGKVCDVL